jgi:hypothetical protein
VSTHCLLQMSQALVADVGGTLETMKALSLEKLISFDASRVEAILKIGLSNALNVGGFL